MEFYQYSDERIDAGRRLSYSRPYLLEGGTEKWVYLRECECGDRRGPEGGVCGCCGQAIPGQLPQSPEPQPDREKKP